MEIREKLARQEHQRSLQWARRMLSILRPILESRQALGADKDYVPTEPVTRAFAALEKWERQVQEGWGDLSDKQKGDYLKWVDEILEVTSAPPPVTGLQIGDRVRPKKAKWDANFRLEPHGPYFPISGTKTIDGVLRYSFRDLPYLWLEGDLEKEGKPSSEGAEQGV